MLVSTSFWSGAFVNAHEHSEKVLALYDPERARSPALISGTDSAVAALSVGAWALWYLGYPDQALKRASEALGGSAK